MTSARLASTLAILTILGCTDDKRSDFDGNASGTGGTGGAASEGIAGAAPTAGAAGTVGGTSATGGLAATAGGNPASIASGGSAGAAIIGTAPTTRCADATTAALTLTHTATSGQPNSIVGATTIAAGSTASVAASEVALKFCFSVVGSVTLTSNAGMSIDSASISGGSVNYVNLSGTTRNLESTDESNRYCIVFDVGSVTESRSVTVTGATAITYNWRFDERSVDVGLVFDPRAKNAPELKALLNGSLAACQVLL